MVLTKSRRAVGKSVPWRAIKVAGATDSAGSRSSTITFRRASGAALTSALASSGSSMARGWRWGSTGAGVTGGEAAAIKAVVMARAALVTPSRVNQRVKRFILISFKLICGGLLCQNNASISFEDYTKNFNLGQ
jgi:hypothetical protein